MKKQLLLGLLSVALVLGGCTSMDSMKSRDMLVQDGIFLKNGKVMETKMGKTSDLMMDVMLKNGTKIMADGTVLMKDGTKSMLMEGEMYDFDGMKSMKEVM